MFFQVKIIQLSRTFVSKVEGYKIEVEWKKDYRAVFTGLCFLRNLRMGPIR
jgi:hypothetical protein